MQSWPMTELEELVAATIMDEGSWLYCPVCGMELAPIEPDDEMAWCPTCNAKVKIESVRSYV